MLCILECSNIQITGQEIIYILYILQFLKCCSLEPPSRKTLYVWPPETLAKLHVQDAQSVNASKIPIPNKCSEDSLRLEFRLLETLGERKQRDSFTWTMKHSSTDWQRVGNDLPVQLKSVVYHKMNGTF